MAVDRETCLFYSKTNGCRYGVECTKAHRVPVRSRVVVVKNMYLYPRNDPESALEEKSIQIHLDLFYEDWFSELSTRYGPVRRLVLASNSCPQLLGNIYVEFCEEEAAARCVEGLGRRYYSGKKIVAELGCCYKIDDGMCADGEKGTCGKGEKCGFIHAARGSEALINELFCSQSLLYREAVCEAKTPVKRMPEDRGFVKRPRRMWSGGGRRNEAYPADRWHYRRR